MHVLGICTLVACIYCPHACEAWWQITAGYLSWVMLLRARSLSWYCMQVCVAGLCIKQKDLLHAGYLAITLLFFRQRYLLMTAPAAQQGIAVRGARLFAWLPAFNLVVMTLTLLYQVGCRSCSHTAVLVDVCASHAAGNRPEIGNVSVSKQSLRPLCGFEGKPRSHCTCFEAGMTTGSRPSRLVVPNC